MIQFAPRTSPAAPSTSCAEKMINAMEYTMREMAFAGENVTPETLKQHGFNEAVIQRYGPKAADRARRRSIRRIEHAGA